MPAFQTLRQQTFDRIVKAKLADADDNGIVIPTIWSSKVRGTRAALNILPDCPCALLVHFFTWQVACPAKCPACYLQSLSVILLSGLHLS